MPGMRRYRELECSQQFGEKSMEMRNIKKMKDDINFQNLKNLVTNAFLDFVGTTWTLPEPFLTLTFVLSSCS